MKKYHNVFMKIAELWAEQSYCKRNKVGAVLVKDNEVFAHGYNGTLIGDDNSCEEEVVICPVCGKRSSKKSNLKLYFRKNGKEYYILKCYSCNNEVEVTNSDFKFLTKEGVMHAEQNAIIFSARDGKSTKDAIMYVTTSPCIVCASMIFHAGIKKVIYKNEYKDKSGIKLLRRKGVEVISFNDLVKKEKL